MDLMRPEIVMLTSIQFECPNVRKAVQLLNELMEAVDRQSDGWAYWQAPRNATKRLGDLLGATIGSLMHPRRDGKITEDQLAWAIKPIRTMVKVQKQVQAKHGNKFEFDVDGALANKPVWKVSIHRLDGEPAIVYRAEAHTSVHAIQEALLYAVRKGILFVGSIEVEEEA